MVVDGASGAMSVGGSESVANGSARSAAVSSIRRGIAPPAGCASSGSGDEMFPVVCRPLAAVLVALFCISCATLPSKSASYSVGHREKGVASWYGPGFHGRTTSSGEVYDMHGMTAAHRTMPFGTRIRVKNRENGRVVNVKVNDRGPFIKGRTLDLSLGAAKVLGMVESGVVPVEIRVIGRSPGRSGRRAAGRPEAYTVQVGAFVRQENAYLLKRTLEKRYRPVSIVTARVMGRDYYRVRVGRLGSEREASRLAARLERRENLQALVVRRD